MQSRCALGWLAQNVLRGASGTGAGQSRSERQYDRIFQTSSLGSASEAKMHSCTGTDASVARFAF